MMRLKRVIEGLTLVSVGLMLLANSAGLLGWRVWITVLSLWPVLLIAIGVDIIGKGSRQHWLRVISSLIVAGGLAYAVFMAPLGPVRWTLGLSGSAQEFEFVEPADRDAEEASMRVELPVARLDIADGRDLVTASGRAPFVPEMSVEREGSAYAVVLDARSRRPFIGLDGEPWAEIGLARDVVWDLGVDTGVADSTIDLSALEISRVDVESGVAMIDLMLGEPAGRRDIPVDIDAGICDVTVRVPEDAEMSFRSEIGLGSVGYGFRAGSDREWRSEGFERASHRYVIVVKGGIGSVRVERY